MSREDLRRWVQRLSPELNQEQVEAVLVHFDRRREEDPLCSLQEGALQGGPEGGQVTPFKMQPNFEIAMYLAQATGSCIVTDSEFRWRELNAAAGLDILKAAPLSHLRTAIGQAAFVVPHDLQDIGMLADRGVFAGYPGFMRKVFRYLSTVSVNGPKPNVEANLLAEFKRIHAATNSAAKRPPNAQVLGFWPSEGIQDNTVNRLLLMSSSEHHLPSTPMALFIKCD